MPQEKTLDKGLLMADPRMKFLIFTKDFTAFLNNLELRLKSSILGEGYQAKSATFNSVVLIRPHSDGLLVPILNSPCSGPKGSTGKGGPRPEYAEM